MNTIKKILELAYEGKHGADGTVLTKEEIKQIADNYKEDDAPVVIGHSGADDKQMAYGRVKSLWTEDRNGKLYLIGEVELLNDIAEYYDLGLYNRWSIGIAKNAEGKWYLHHLALLGAVPPKIKGLRELQNYSDTDIQSFDFADSPKYMSKAKINRPICDCPDGYNWDATGAKKRIVEKYGWATLKTCVGAVDVSSEDTPQSFSKYKFPFCDVVNGKLMIIPKAVSAGIAYLHGARGVKIPSNLASVVRPVFEKLQKKIEKAKDKNMSDNYSDNSNKDGGDIDMTELEKLKKELEEKEKQLKEFAERAKQYQEKLKAEKREKLKKALEGKLPKEKLDRLLEFADSIGTEKTVNFGDKKEITIYEALEEIFNDLITAKLTDEKFKKDEGKDDDKNFSDLASKF